MKHIRGMSIGVTESTKFMFIFSTNSAVFLIISSNTNIWLCIYIIEKGTGNFTEKITRSANEKYTQTHGS